MELKKILNKIYESKDEVELFDCICYFKSFIEENGSEEFFEERISQKGEKFLVIKNDYTIQHICEIFTNLHFIESVLSVLKYQRDYKELKSVPEKILKDGHFINLSLNCCFYLIAFFSSNFIQANIEFIGKHFWNAIKRMEEGFLYEFSKIDILNALENIIFDGQYFFQKDFPIKIDVDEFYYNFKKSRLIIGNYLIDFSIPILLSNSLKEIVGVKKKAGDEFSLKDSANRLRSILKKYIFLSKGFKFGDLVADKSNTPDKTISSFDYYFKVRESKKILLLINSVIDGLDDFSQGRIFEKINNSSNILSKIKKFFYENYNVFPSYNGPKIKTGQWSNKSFLNTIKFFALLETIKQSEDDEWKANTFLKYFSDWVDDLHENVNYFSELDDYNRIRIFLKSRENNSVEFKSTFGLPLRDCENKEEFNSVKKSIVDQIGKTILAMANSDGGNIFIGVVEKIEEVSDSIKPYLSEKDGMCFLDIQFSLKKEKEDFDKKRLLLQQMLKSLTKERLDFLDSLFSFHFYKIYIESKRSCIEILSIEVQKSQKVIFMVERDSWITMPKRLNGRVELVNPAEELLK